MLQEDGNKKVVTTFNIGIDKDSVPEMTEQGYYVDACNMEDANAVSGAGKGLSKIGGELPLYIQNTQYTANAGELTPIYFPIIDANNWLCIGVGDVNDHVVEFWVYNGTNTQVLGTTIIRIDGIIMCYTDKMGLLPQYPLQLDVNDSCVGGEIFITDNNIHPYIFNIQDIIDNYYSSPATEAYFSNFNISIYSVTLSESIDHPVFDELVPVGGNGLTFGSYAYSIRLVDSTGNHTSWSIQTPYIPVPKTMGGSTVYGNRTYGGDTSLQSPYAIHIRFRINNIANYSYVEIRRVVQNTGQALNYTPTGQSTKFILDYITGIQPDIIVNPNAVWNFLDESSVTWIDLTSDDEAEIQSAFDTCKAIRYYDDKLVLMNIKYPSKDVSGLNSSIFIDRNAQLGFPVVENMGKSGHKDIFNQVYFRNNQSGEREGYAVEFIDALGTKSFALPFNNGAAGVLQMDDFVMPNRRIPLTHYADSFDYSYGKWRGAPLASDVNHSNLNIGETRTFERFDLGDHNTLGVAKTDSSSTISIKKNDPYNPLKPEKEAGNTSLLNYNVNGVVGLTSGTATEFYNPAGFNPRYFSQGMAFNGLKTAALPSWVKGFSIVKKKKAGRVVCQGLGIYTMKDPVHNTISATKETSKIWFYSPDMTVGQNSDVAAFIANPQNYKIQLVSPLGFFTEMYNADHIGLGADQKEDLISYARLLYNDYNINPGLESNVSGNSPYYTEFGRWRNGQVAPIPFSTPEFAYNISGIQKITTGNLGIGQQDFYEISVVDVNGNPLDIYHKSGISGLNQPVNSHDVEDWHEPLYIVNIIDDSATFVANNTTSYTETGHLQKLESTIGKSIGQIQTLPLVDERWEDCIPNPFLNGFAQTTSSENRYCFVNGYRWLNITYIADISPIVTALTNNGVYVDSDGNFCYGVFTNDNKDFSLRKFNLIFQQVSTLPAQYCIPQIGVGSATYITIRYDNRIPIKLFAGDSFIGETIFQPLQTTDGNEYKFKNGLPYVSFEMQQNYKIFHVRDTLGVRYLDQQSPNYVFGVGDIRQWVIMFCCESNVNIPLTFNIDSTPDSSSIGAGTYSPDQSFPLIHYVQHPLPRAINGAYLSPISDNFGHTTLGGYLIDEQYDVDFPSEFQWWHWGGFKVNQQYNIDYSKQLNDNSNTSKPLVGFKEQTLFCSRVIWSESRNINVQDSPNLKSFGVNNIFDISDKTQEIKYAFDDMSSKGGNLFAITGKGICLLFTDKTLLSDTTLGQVALINPTTTGWIQGEYWLSKTIGSNDEMWRGIAEYINECFIPNNESVFRLAGTQIVDIGRAGKDQSKSMIAGSEGECRGSYYSKLYPALASVRQGYQTPVCAVYNVKDKTYWLKIGINQNAYFIERRFNLNTLYLSQTIGSGDYISLTGVANSLVIMPNMLTDETLILSNTGIHPILLQGLDLTTITLMPNTTFVFTRDTSSYGWVESTYDVNEKAKVFVFSENPNKLAWQSVYDYNFDKMLCVRKYTNPTSLNLVNDIKILGMRKLTTYKLKEKSSGIINGLPVNGYVIIAVSPEGGMTKEYIDFLINGDQPIRVEFSETEDGLPMCYLDSSISTMYVKNFRGSWYNQVPRKTAVPPSTSRYRLQNDVMYVKIIHNVVGDFIIKDVTTGYKTLI